MNDWKTTTLGILTILAGLVNAAMDYLNGKNINYPTLIAAITAGWGLIHAKDSSTPNLGNVTNSAGAAKLGALLLGLVLILGLAVTPVHAQTMPTTLYGVGMAGSPYATPPVAGMGLFAKQITGTTYSATLFQVIPNNQQKFTVTSNVGTGIAQQLFVIPGTKYAVYGMATGGISWQSSNVGLSFNGAATVPLRYKKSNWYALPFVGWNKSAVANGTGYQLTAGTIVSWGN